MLCHVAVLFVVFFFPVVVSSSAAELWDVAVGRRPYVAEQTGALLLHLERSTAGQQAHVSASLPCVSRSWSWQVEGGADHVLSLGSLAGLPARLNNDIIVNVTLGGTALGEKRRRFMRAAKADPRNTVQVDHHTAGLLVDGEPWAGVGWYVYKYLSFQPKQCSEVNQSTPAGAEDYYNCAVWGIGNATAAMASMAEQGINMVMMYEFTLFGKHRLPKSFGPGYPNATALMRELLLRYFDTAARHKLKVMLHMASMGLNAGDYTNTTLEWLRESVALVKDHPALLGYYICDDCSPKGALAKVYNTLKELDPFHLTIGAAFGGSLPKYSDVTVDPRGFSDDRLPVLPGLRLRGEKVTGVQPRTPLMLDYPMVENYNPSPDAHAKTDFRALRAGVPFEPVVNCDGSYSMEEHIKRHKPPKLLLTNMWMSTVVAGTVSQLVFVGSHPQSMEGMSADQWASKSSWMLYMQPALYSAEIRVLLPSLYAPFGLPQPTAVVEEVVPLLPPGPGGMPRGKRVVARAWRRHTASGWCGHLVVASGLEQTSAKFTVRLAGSFPAHAQNQTALRLFDADYVVQISPAGLLTDWIGAAEHNVYQLGDCRGAQSETNMPQVSIVESSNEHVYV